ncbi:hypothetical protein G6F57_010084 [Rhizopus arrhizus]|nr:hypothetical protein G6F24_008629 [Rhizopus arrhizus]KAG1416825.1 hypothetical protein G6F58_005795 [Rhizopus delemar]KAG0784264.1 hypothetical protein G6F21_010014 [Rhizopus arrhizus]KAG0810702.1 hypothetical protein G6F20_007753 [Rhizopus arrhizus]KAG0834632.1 hypothetical protein G6F19_005113 [Rhizopus arrhizus]
MCDVSDPRILNAYYSITEDEPINWLLLGYKDSRNVISLYACGTNGLSEFRDSLTNEILFGFIRVEDKFILVTYVPDSVNGVRRARALVHSRSVAQICQLSHAQITASSLTDLSDSNIRTRLKLGENQVPNRARPTASKRSSLVMNNRRRSAQYVSPIITTPTAPERKSLIINTVTTEEPENLDIPTTPTSVTTSFSDTTTVVDCNSSVSSKDYYEKTKASEEEEKPSATELLFQTQLLKKREMEEARFRQTLKKEEQTKEKPQAIQLEHKPTDDTNRSLGKRSSHLFSTSSTLLNTPTKNAPAPATTQPLSAATTKRTTNTATKNGPVINNEHRVDEPKKRIMTGFVSVQTRKSPFWKRRCFVAEKERLLFYKDETFVKTAIVSIDLSSVTRLAPANEDEDTFVPNSFIIDTPTDSYQLLADDKKTGKSILATLQGLL